MVTPLEIISLVKQLVSGDKFSNIGALGAGTDEIMTVINNMNESKDELGLSTLIVAIIEGEIEVVEWLIKFGIEICGSTAFQNAVMSGNRKLITLLLDEGCQVSEREFDTIYDLVYFDIHENADLSFVEFVYDELTARGRCDEFAQDLIEADYRFLVELLLSEKYKFQGEIYERWLFKTMRLELESRPNGWRQRAQELIDSEVITFTKNKEINKSEWWKLCTQMEDDFSDEKWLFDNLQFKLNINNSIHINSLYISHEFMTPYALKEFSSIGLKFNDESILAVLFQKFHNDEYFGNSNDEFYQIKFMIEKSRFNVNGLISCTNSNMNILKWYSKYVDTFNGFIPNWQNDFINFIMKKGLDVHTTFLCEGHSVLSSCNDCIDDPIIKKIIGSIEKAMKA